MDPKTVSLREANQQFSRLIAEVEDGTPVTLTRHGKPVARLVPYSGDHRDDPEWRKSHREMTALLEAGAPLGGLRVSRDDLYDR
ncbi:MAG: type II toxin-antitoxin system Phd/YefM family antitoxin [Alphaproteobacteria bacterium]